MPTEVQVVDAREPGPALGPHTGFGALALEVLDCDAGQPRAVDSGADEVLFVLEGSGELELSGERHRLEPESGAHLQSGERYTLHPTGAQALRVVAVTVPDAPAGERAAVVSRAGDHAAQAATTDREFRIVADAASGLSAATHFVGYIPTVRAPEHFHTYDEVIYVLDGVGVMHAQGREQPLAPGSAIQLPARTVHCLENTGDHVMRIVAVFRPSGSPAAAYYPDGTPAMPGLPPAPPVADPRAAGTHPQEEVAQ